MARKGNKQKKYSAEFKISVIMDMCENHLGYRETARKYKLGNNVCQGKNLAIKWECIYLGRSGRAHDGTTRQKKRRLTEEKVFIARSGKRSFG